MNNLSEKIQSDVTEAMKAKNEVKVSTLRMLTAAVKNFEIAYPVLRNL